MKSAQPPASKPEHPDAASNADAEEHLNVDGFLLDALRATACTTGAPLQTLWGGQGSIVRVTSDSREHPVAMLKLIQHDRQATHPRGWSSAVSFSRKVQSYVVECCWYEHYAYRCQPFCKVPVALGVQQSATHKFILMEDLSDDYPRRCSELSVNEVGVCLTWLANFHACFMQTSTPGLWSEGSYWHLATRREEYAAMPEGAIKRAAETLDYRLCNTRYRSLVHGDAKVANFCFSDDLSQVAAVDFQYVGQGCGMRDVVYLLGSCLAETDCSRFEQQLLDGYFKALREALSVRWADSDCALIEQEWRGLYDIAWTDFHRFLLGWMPTHPKINRYTRAIADRTLATLPHHV